MQSKTVTVEQAADLLGLSRGFAYRMARTGELPVIRLGRKVLVSRAGLERLLAGAESSVGVQEQRDA